MANLDLAISIRQKVITFLRDSLDSPDYHAIMVLCKTIKAIEAKYQITILSDITTKEILKCQTYPKE